MVELLQRNHYWGTPKGIRDLLWSRNMSLDIRPVKICPFVWWVHIWDFWFQLPCLCETQSRWTDDLHMCGSHRGAWRRSCDVLGCFPGDTVSDLFRIQGTLNQHGYHSILQRYAVPSGLRLVGLSFVFQQDSDTKHTSRLCKGYLTKKESDGMLHQMTWPPQSHKPQSNWDGLG
jgi:hypothetical protein